MSRLLRVAVPVPLPRLFDYAWPAAGPMPAPGCRVRVPFGARQLVGVVVAHPQDSPIAPAKLKPAGALDETPILDAPLLSLLLWLADYYHHPVGEVVAAALPALLRQGQPAEPAPEERFMLTAAGRDIDPGTLSGRAARQARVLAALAADCGGLSREQLPVPLQVLRRLEAKGWLQRQLVEPTVPGRGAGSPPAFSLVAAQANAVAQISAALAAYQGFLLHGVTGSGKTEVYMQLMAEVARRGLQTLYLVPEIGLTPQLVARLRERFGSRLALAHSGLSDRERLTAWQAARSGSAPILVGTRSAVFAPLPRPGLIIVDEEHDSSFKQQDGFRYSARDVAVARAQRLEVPVVLGTATPSLETFFNAERGRYRRLRLPERVGAAGQPSVRVIDLARHGFRDGLSTPLLSALGRHLEAGNQALIFLNRRGFAPALFCAACRVCVPCLRCDAPLTVHRGSALLKCHHCGHQRALPSACESCGGPLLAVGEGTQRVEQALAQVFPGAVIRRIDRDSTRGRGELEQALSDVERGEVNILVGTQMLTKGHDFPRVTLVAVLNADQGLFSSDFRASERLAQTIVQVAGRSGRAERPGEVFIQTHYPEHPLLATLLQEGYEAFARAALAERLATGWPPASALAILRAEAVDARATERFLQAALGQAQTRKPSGVTLLGPAPPAMERRAGRHRSQLLLLGDTRPALQAMLKAWLPGLARIPESRRTRWSLDVDPSEI